MTLPLKYAIYHKEGMPQVSISQRDAASLLRRLLWVAGWSLAVLLIFKFWGVGFFSLIVALVCLLPTLLGVYAVLQVLVCRTVQFLPGELKVRSSFLGFGRTRSFAIAQIREFGFGLAGHPLTPVLRFVIGKKWITLAHNIREEDAAALVRALQEAGVAIPS